MGTNYFKGVFAKSNGEKVEKIATSTSKSCTELRRETIDKWESHGYAYRSGSMGTKNSSGKVK